MSCKKSNVDINKKLIQETDTREILKNVFGLFISHHIILNHTTEYLFCWDKKICIKTIYIIYGGIVLIKMMNGNSLCPD